LDVHGGKDEEGRKVIVWKRHNGLNQRWRVVYLDDKKAEPTTGLDKDSGFYRNRPFFIVSRMNAHRVIEVTGGRNLVIKTKASGRNT